MKKHRSIYGNAQLNSMDFIDSAGKSFIYLHSTLHLKFQIFYNRLRFRPKILTKNFGFLGVLRKLQMLDKTSSEWVVDSDIGEDLAFSVSILFCIFF